MNVAHTNTQLALTADERTVAAWNFLLTMAAGDCIRLAVYSSDSTASIIGQPARTNPDRPVIPPAIVTMQQIA